MQMRRVDATDPHDFDEWFSLFARCDHARDGVSGQGWHPDEWRARASADHEAKVWHLLSFGDLGQLPVAVASAEVGRDDNLHWLRTDLQVDPELRRRGHGTAALHVLENYTRSLGRQSLVVNVMEGSNEVGRAPNRSFAPLMGYRIADEAVRRDIAWPRPTGELDRLHSAWEPFAADYEIVLWQGSTPNEWVADRIHLSAVMPSEAPYADLDVHEEKWDEQRLREHEHTVKQMGRELFVAVALHRPTHRLVGYSELTSSREFTETAYQWDTFVLKAHRGHRLGGLLKIANMKQPGFAEMNVSRISTFNSSLNEPMIRVNDELGSQVTESSVMWRKDLELD